MAAPDPFALGLNAEWRNPNQLVLPNVIEIVAEPRSAATENPSPGKWREAIGFLPGRLDLQVFGNAAAAANGGTFNVAPQGDTWISVLDAVASGDVRSRKDYTAIGGVTYNSVNYPDGADAWGVDNAGSYSGYVDKGLVSLLLHFDGPDGSTEFTDSSLWVHAMTANGGAVISAAQSKIGGASGFFNGTDAFLNSAVASELNLGTSTPGGSGWKVEFWFFANNVTTTQRLVTLTTGSSSGGIYLLNTGRIEFGAFGSWGTSNANTAVNPNTWYHVALVYRAGTTYLYINGTQQATDTRNPFPNANCKVEIGQSTTHSAFFNGYIDELRIVRGAHMYGSNFLAQAVPFPDPVSFTGRLAQTPSIPPFAFANSLILQNRLAFQVGNGFHTTTMTRRFVEIEVNGPTPGPSPIAIEFAVLYDSFVSLLLDKSAGIVSLLNAPAGWRISSDSKSLQGQVNFLTTKTVYALMGNNKTYAVTLKPYVYISKAVV